MVGPRSVVCRLRHPLILTLSRSAVGREQSSVSVLFSASLWPFHANASIIHLNSHDGDGLSRFEFELVVVGRRLELEVSLGFVAGRWDDIPGHLHVDEWIKGWMEQIECISTCISS